MREKAMGRKHTAKSRAKMSASKKGSIPWNKKITE